LTISSISRKVERSQISKFIQFRRIWSSSGVIFYTEV